MKTDSPRRKTKPLVLEKLKTKTINLNKVNFTTKNEIEEKKLNLEKKEIKKQGKKLLMDILSYDDNMRVTYQENCKQQSCVSQSDKTLPSIIDLANLEKLFSQTRYVSQGSIEEFFKKYHEYTELQRKGMLNKLTPSYAFIKATEEHLLIPNPLGLLKRQGEKSELSLKYVLIIKSYPFFI